MNFHTAQAHRAKISPRLQRAFINFGLVDVGQEGWMDGLDMFKKEFDRGIWAMATRLEVLDEDGKSGSDFACDWMSFVNSVCFWMKGY